MKQYTDYEITSAVSSNLILAELHGWTYKEMLEHMKETIERMIDLAPEETKKESR